MKIISIIPARGGSRRVKKKNIKLLAGKPLIAYTIIEAIKSEKFENIIVSTEDPEIAKISKYFGAEIMYRPPELAKDDTSIISVIFHLIEQYQDQFDDSTIIVLLQPTSPLRTRDDIKKCIDLYLNTNCDSLVSVYRCHHPPYWSLEIKNGYLKPLSGMTNLKKDRKAFGKIYYPNGAIYIASIETLIKYKSFYCENTIPYIMPLEKSIDIDTELDFLFAEFLLKKMDNKNEKN